MFEQDQDYTKEKQAIELYLKRSGGSYKKLSPQDVDFRILSDTNSVIGYAEVKVLDTDMKNSFPLQVDARKIIKLRDKRLSAVMIWMCIDGILYLPIEGLVGSSHWDKTTGELVLSYSNKKLFKYVRKPQN
mgnify:FL=1|jgi:hypothetical protein|tara:strand:+ start:851 stop:1243 length:393 start_codon:yes stop_codon:yes gene_type:complete